MHGHAGWMLAGLVLMGASGFALGDEGVRREQADVVSGAGRLLYRETHYVADAAASERWVLYRCPDGRPFARKHVRASQRPAAPDFAMEDGRDGYREGVRSGPGGRVAYVRERIGAAESARVLRVPPDGVIDAGFDAAVREQWAALMKGEALRMQFLVPSRQRFYPVRVQRTGSVDWNGIRAERLRMRVDAWFGFAVPEVALVYARDDRRLLEFSGTGNVRDARGANPQVRIAFDPRVRKAPTAELAQARQVPLDGRCGS